MVSKNERFSVNSSIFERNVRLLAPLKSDLQYALDSFVVGCNSARMKIRVMKTKTFCMSDKCLDFQRDFAAVEEAQVFQNHICE